MRRNWNVLMPAVLLAAAGCSGPSLVRVSGIVTIDGKPLTHGYIQILPAGWRPAFAKIEPNGSFVLTTSKANDGCLVGTHPVVVLASEHVNPETIRWHAPKKYADSATTPLTVTISQATSDLRIELTWDGGRPFIEKLEREGQLE